MKKEQGAMRKEDSEEEKSRELHLLVVKRKLQIKMMKAYKQ